MKYQNGEDFLNHLNKNMYTEDMVMHHANKNDSRREKIRKQRREYCISRVSTNRGLNSLQTVISDLYFNNLMGASGLTSLIDIRNIIISPNVNLQQIVKNNQKNH